MKKTNECIICNSKKLKVFKAYTSPFITERIWNQKPLNVELDWCKNCNFAFYNPRLEENELKLLYKGYRDENYQQQRYKHEPYYTKEVNDLIGNNKIEIAERKANLFEILDKNIDISNIKNVLDFGGDKGQFIIDEFADANKFVFDISGVDAVDNIIKITDYNECKNNKYDFIMCCHVLEHVESPMEIMQNIKELSDKNTIIYFELPLEFPFIYKNLSKFKKIIRMIPFINPLIPNIEELYKKRNSLFIGEKTDEDKSKSLIKLLFNLPKYIKKLLTLGRFYMHEHLNFFTPESIEKLLILNGFENISTEIKEINCGWANYKVISCLAKISN